MCVAVPTTAAGERIVVARRRKSIPRRVGTLTITGGFMNKDQVKGRVEEAVGNVKETVGKITDDEKLELEGKVQKKVGKVRAGFGDLKEDIKNA